MSTSHPRSELGQALRAMSPVFASAALFSGVINILMLTPALYMLQVYDRVLSSRNEATLLLLTLLMVGMLCLEGALSFVRGRVLIRAAAGIDVSLSQRVFDAMFANSLQGRGGAGMVLADLGHVRHFLSGKALLALFDLPWLPIYLVVVFLLSPWLALFAVLSMGVLVALAMFNEWAVAALCAESARTGSQVANEAAAVLQKAEVAQAMGMIDALRGRWLARHFSHLAVQAEASDRGSSVGNLARGVRTVLQSSILGVGAWLVLSEQMSPGGMIAASILLGRTLAPLDQAIGGWRSFVAARQAVARLNRLLCSHPAATDKLSLPPPSGVLQVEGITVAAPSSQEAILKSVSFQLRAGEVLGVIGPSGGGKSTLVRALLGVWQPLSGTVRLAGADVATWNRTELGPHVGYLPQDVALFDGTVAENIARFGPTDAPRIVDAAKQAGVHELILRLPAGYETQLGEGGVVLSGGQRQRIGLARALYGSPTLIVLDEPNANLDEAGDAALLTAIKGLKAAGKTVVIVTHRANLLSEADSVLVLVEGRVQAFGPRGELLKPCLPKAVPQPIKERA